MAAFAVLPCGGAIAQSSDPANDNALDEPIVDEIVVTARRREEAIVDVPGSITSLSGELLEDAGVRTAQELLTNVTGVHFEDTTAPIQGEISIRGSATSLGTNADATVGVYRDGIFVLGGRFGGRRFSRIDLFDVERVEVFRGGQAALYGRNAVGGAINVISKKPDTDEFTVSVLGGVGNNERYEARGIINIPLGENFAFRGGVDYVDQSEGFFYNPLLDDYYDNEEFTGFKGAIRFDSGPIDATLSYDISDSDGRTIALQVAPPASANNPLPVQQGEFSMEHNSPDFFKEEIDNVALNISVDFEWAELVSSTGYRERKTDTSLDIDFIAPSFNEAIVESGGRVTANPNLISLSQITASRIFQNLHLVGKAAGDRLTWLVGGDWTRFEDDYARQFLVLTAPAAGFHEFQDLEFDSWSLYGSLGFDFTDRLNVTAELRHSDDNKDFTSSRFNPLTGAPLSDRFFVDSVNEDTSLDPTLTIQYDLAPNWMGYLRYASAYRSGGFNENLGSPDQPVDVPASYEKETYDTYEVGTKATIGDGMLLTIAAFFNEGSNVLASLDNGCRPNAAVCPERPTNFLTNAGSSEVTGIEFETAMRGRVFGGRYRLTAGATLQDGEYVRGPFEGIDVPRLPEFIYTVMLNYNQPIAAGWRGFFNVHFHGQRGGRQDLVTDFDLSDYDLTDLRIGIRNGTWSLALESRNLFDEKYSVRRLATSNRINRPRTNILRLTADF